MTSVQSRVKTNVITGFLGVGKTTLIHALLKQKPANERWAVLVNEFGEIGIDGAFFSGHKEDGIYVREVPGGCMCCTSSLPMQIALSQLLSYAKPTRLLIEPTGLGHPTEVLETLQESHYQSLIDLRATLTLVDARKISDSKYGQHPSFQQQLKIADHILAAKQDLYSEDSMQQLVSYLNRLGLQDVPVNPVAQGEIPLSVLDDPCKHNQATEEHHHHTDQQASNIEQTLASQGWVKVNNKGEGFYSSGWIFSADHCFSFKQVMTAITGVIAERLKAVFITEQGIYAFNLAEGALSCFEIDESVDSRLEFIVDDKQQAEILENQLQAELFAEYQI